MRRTCVPPLRGEVWLVDYEPEQTDLQYEQAGRRPAAVVSADAINSRGRIVILVPLTGSRQPSHWFLPVLPPEGGLNRPSVAVCNQVRTVTQARLLHRLGRLDANTLARIAQRVQMSIGV